MDFDKINLKVDEVKVFETDHSDNSNPREGTIRIIWSADIGFGQYDISFYKDGRITGDSELMDNNENKQFIKKLMEVMIDKIDIR